MNATLSFDLEDHDERRAHLRASISLDLALALSELRDLRRQIQKSDFETVEALTDHVTARIGDILESLPISLDELMI